MAWVDSSVSSCGRRGIARLEAEIGQRRVGIVLLVLLAVAYLAAYFGHPELPTTTETPGWWGWQDQAKYRTVMEGLRQGSLDRHTYWVSFGYPATALPFADLMPLHPFLIPNLLMALGIAVAFWALSRRFLGRIDCLVLISLVLWTLRDELIRTLVVPWTTIPTQLVAYLAIYIHAARPGSIRSATLVGCLVAFAYLCRAGDAACLLPLVVGTISTTPRAHRVRGALGGLLPLAAVFVLDRLVNARIFGGVRSRYEAGLRGTFFNEDLLQKSYSIFSEGWTIYRVDEPMLAGRFPWLLLACPGLVWMATRLGRRVIAPALSVTACWILYLAYDYFAPTDLYHFNLVHYVAWTLPVFALAAYLTLRRAWRELDRRTFGGLLFLGLLPAFVELEEHEQAQGRVGPDGHVMVETDPESDVRVDLLVVERAAAPQRLTAPVRRVYQAPGPDAAGVFHLSEPVALDHIRFRDSIAIGSRVSARRLRFRPTAHPPFLRTALDSDHRRP